MNLAKTQKFTETIAHEAGQLLLKHFGKSKITVQKGCNDFATNADIASEKLIIKAIKKQFPDHAILAEESGVSTPGVAATPGVAQYTWVIDPLDGTRNFQAKLPIWCVSIALLKDGEPIIGVIYCPVLHEMHSARLGGGAKLNGRKLAVSEVNKLKDTTVIAGIPGLCYGPNHDKAARKMSKILKNVFRVRSFGAAAYEIMMVARGFADAYIDLSGTTKLWDVAAAMVIVREAGGVIYDHTEKHMPKHYKAICASNAKLTGKIQKII